MIWIGSSFPKKVVNDKDSRKIKLLNKGGLLKNRLGSPAYRDNFNLRDRDQDRDRKKIDDRD